MNSKNNQNGHDDKKCVNCRACYITTESPNIHDYTHQINNKKVTMTSQKSLFIPNPNTKSDKTATTPQYPNALITTTATKTNRCNTVPISKDTNISYRTTATTLSTIITMIDEAKPRNSSTPEKVLKQSESKKAETEQPDTYHGNIMEMLQAATLMLLEQSFQQGFEDDSLPLPVNNDGKLCDFCCSTLQALDTGLDIAGTPDLPVARILSYNFIKG